MFNRTPSRLFIAGLIAATAFTVVSTARAAESNPYTVAATRAKARADKLAACVANPQPCIDTEIDRAHKAIDRAEKRLAILTSTPIPEPTAPVPVVVGKSRR